METVNVFEYEPKYQPYFENLNRQWIEKYFHLEPVDIEVLTHPDELIVDHGGTILFAALNEEVVGTVALKKEDGDSFELCKMAVSEQARGKHVGLILGEAALNKARAMGAKRVILYSQRTFNNSIAINLYYRLGFKEVELEKGGYERCDIKMLFDFKAHDYLKNTADRLRKIVVEARRDMENIPLMTWNAKVAMTTWSRKEILGHLIDSASNNHQRFVRAQYTDKLIFPKYHQVEWVTFQNYQHADLSQIIGLWYGYNLQLAWVIENIHHQKLETICEIGDYEPMTLKELVEDYIVHLLHHLEQILP